MQWSPEYRCKILRTQENKNLCEKIIRAVASRHEIKIIELTIMPDQITFIL
ncbi:MAG: transposase [Candidatus Thermoplasmatota archaeon]|nr:transposase [Candidatus Thermoplasmatota archaeon]MBS3801123.1 transposase [Candidatus Thermoplasmatota archaeon]